VICGQTSLGLVAGGTLARTVSETLDARAEANAAFVA